MDIFGPKSGDSHNFISAIDGVDALMGGFLAGLDSLAEARAAAQDQHDEDNYYYQLYVEAETKFRQLQGQFDEFKSVARQLCAANDQQAVVIAQQASQIENLYAVLKNRQRIKT